MVLFKIWKPSLYALLFSTGTLCCSVATSQLTGGSSGGSSPRDPDLHQLELDRIRQELAGFKPIATTKSTPALHDDKTVSAAAAASGKRTSSSKYTTTKSMTSLQSKASSSKARGYQRTKDATRSYGPEYY